MTDFEPATRYLVGTTSLAREGDHLPRSGDLTTFCPILDSQLRLVGHPLTADTFHIGDIVQFQTSDYRKQAFRRIGPNMWAGSGVFLPPSDSGAYHFLRCRAVLIRDGITYWPWGNERLRAIEESKTKRTPHNGADNQPVIEDCVRELLGRAVLSKSTKDELQALVEPVYKDGTVALVLFLASRRKRTAIGRWNAATRMWEFSWNQLDNYGDLTPEHGQPGTQIPARTAKVLKIIRDGKD